MKIVICGDTHIGAIFGLGGPNGKGGNTRVDDFERTLNHIIDYAIDNKVDAFIQTGDAFEERTPLPEHVSIWNRALRRLSLANITSVIIMGNHDYRRTGENFTSSISSLEATYHPNIRTVLKPQILTLNNTGGSSVDIVLLPFRDRRMYDGKTTEEDSKLFDAEAKRLIEGCSGKRPIIAIGHNFFYEGTYKDYSGTEILTHIRTYEKCDLVAMGHYHPFRKMKKADPIAFYTGSMEKQNFGDVKVDKFFFEYNTTSKKVKALKCPSRELFDGFSDLSMCDISGFDNTLNEEIGKLNIKDKVVRYKIAVKDSMLNVVKKSGIRKMLYKQGAFYVSRVNIEPIFTRIAKTNNILKQKDDVSMMTEFIKTQRLDRSITKTLIKEAEAIMKEVK